MKKTLSHKQVQTVTVKHVRIKLKVHMQPRRPTAHAWGVSTGTGKVQAARKGVIIVYIKILDYLRSVVRILKF